jgi:long-chain acyl-CoA synthetase
LNSFAACEAVFPCRAGDVAALPGSLTHSLFLYGAVHGLARGMSLALCDGFQPKSALRLFQSANATVLYAVPAMLDALLTAGFGPWRPRLIFCGGAKLDPLLRARLQQALSNTDIVEFYGASELSFVSYASSSQPAPEGSVGQAFPGVDIAVRGDDGAELPAGHEGLITIRSSLVFSRYPDPAYGDSASIPMPSGWSTAGDMGYLNEHGFLYLTGRMARIVNCKGLKIHPEVIEAVLRSYPGIEAAAAFGVPDAKRGEAIAAVIVPMAGKASPTRKALAEECRARLGRPYTPRLFYQSQSLPMTASGKPAYGQLRDSLIQGEAQFTPLT